MQQISTNDVFHHLIRLLRLTKDNALIIEIFESQGINDVTNSKIKAWSTRSGRPNKAFRSMPLDVLNAFISGLYEYKLVE